MKQNKPITDRQVATFTKLVEQGMLQHLEDTARWEVVDTVNEFLNKFRELPDGEIFATPTSAAWHFWDKGLGDALIRALIAKEVRIDLDLDAEEFAKKVHRLLDLEDFYADPYDQDEAVEQAKSDAVVSALEANRYENRRALCDMLGLGYHTSTEAMITELKTRIE